jgi:hypothetical protein
MAPWAWLALIWPNEAFRHISIESEQLLLDELLKSLYT